MRLLRIVQCVLLAGVTLVAAADPDQSSMPQCAAQCISSATQNQTACATSDSSCLCTSAEFNGQSSACIASSCTVKELLVATKLSLRSCGTEPKERDPVIVPLRTVLFVLGTLLLFIRIANRLLGYGAMKWWWDDYMIFPAYIFAVCFFSSSVILYNYGIGVDMWDLSFYDVTSFMHAFYYCSLVYKVEMAFAKISVCFFFLRIFPSRSFRIYAYIVIGLNAIVGLIFLLVDMLQCSPINAAWKGWAAESPAKCINLPDAVYANGFVNIVLDVIMISLPIYEVSRLKLNVWKKLSAAAMFGTGFILTIIGILRNVNYSHNMQTTNPTYDLRVLHQWAMCEVMISLICACLPDLRIFVLRLVWIARGRPDPTTHRATGYKTYASTKNSNVISVTNELHQTEDYYEISKQARMDSGRVTEDFGKAGSDSDSQMELVDVLRANPIKKPVTSYARRSQ